MGKQNKNGIFQALKANLAGAITDAEHQKGLVDENMAITNFCTVALQAAATLIKSKSPASGYHLVVCVVRWRQFPPTPPHVHHFYTGVAVSWICFTSF